MLGVRRHDLFLWLLASACAFSLALYHISAALAAGTFVPADPDSFYHAHRILDALDAPWRLQQFDPRIHAPEGSWVTWPWAYDMIMAGIAHLAVYQFGVSQPLSVLALVAPLWILVDVAMLIGIANRLRLSNAAKSIAVLCYAFLPLTQVLHRVGMLGHHFAEASLVLATLLLGLAWFQDFARRRHAVALGLLLGMAPAFHNGDFILQLPVLLTLAARWLAGRPGEPAATRAFALALFGSTLLFLLPSEPFRRLMFSFTLQSWFHLYVALCSGVLACLFGAVQRSAKSGFFIAAVALLMLAAILPEAVRGGDFVTGRLAALSSMGEVTGVPGHLAQGDFHFLDSIYTGLLWLMPLAIAASLWKSGLAGDERRFFFIMTLFGASLMMFQFRLEYFGSFALYLPLCLVIDQLRSRWPGRERQVVWASAAVVAAAYIPARAALTEWIPPGASPPYAIFREMAPSMTAACAQAPGVVLADMDDGHFITYHTRCSVIADDFILTAQHEQKIVLVQGLLQSDLQAVFGLTPYVRYIYVRRDMFRPSCGDGCAEYRGLRQTLLFGRPPFPPRLRLVHEVVFQNQTWGRLFEVVPASRPDLADRQKTTRSVGAAQ
jgi:hypothetical protein